MDLSPSECSSGCESGWTVYLDRISNSNDTCFFAGRGVGDKQDDEDLSLISDASSRPPILHGESQYDSMEDWKKSRRNGTNKGKNKASRHDHCLDDTATSPILDSSYKGNAGPQRSRDLSKGEAVSKRHAVSFNASSTKGKSGSLLGKKQ